MKCLICLEAETTSGLTAIPFVRGELRLTIQNVPAQICPSCGEAYVTEDVVSRLLVEAESIFDEGIREEVREY